MKRTFLIARQEFIKYVTRRGFAISILMFPLWIVIVTLVPQWTGGGDAARSHYFTVVDRTDGHFRHAIFCAVVQKYDQAFGQAAQHYAAAYVDESRYSRALKGAPALPSSPNCGASADTGRVIAALAAAKKPGAPDFVAPRNLLSFDDPPAYLANAAGVNFAAAVRRAFTHEVWPDPGNTPLDTVIVIPANFAKGADAEIWSKGRPDGDLRYFVQDALVRALQFDAIHRAAPQLHDPAILDATAELQPRDPDSGGRRANSSDQIVPIALAIILFVVSVMNSSVLLQGVVEEKSTRMIEVLLSCATPREITSGKLIGVIAVALTTLLIWALALFALMAIASHDTVTLVFASLRATASLDTLPFLLLFFLCGLLIYGSLFLAIGSMANSLADAQSLLGPSMLILMLPNLMIAGIMRDPNGTLASTLSWVPIYTPFFMMLRLSSHPPVWQLWGTALLALTTTALLIFWTGRVFAKHVLTTERPPALGKLVAGLFKRRA